MRRENRVGCGGRTGLERSLESSSRRTEALPFGCFSAPWPRQPVDVDRMSPSARTSVASDRTGWGGVVPEQGPLPAAYCSCRQGGPFPHRQEGAGVCRGAGGQAPGSRRPGLGKPHRRIRHPHPLGVGSALPGSRRTARKRSREYGKEKALCREYVQKSVFWKRRPALLLFLKQKRLFEEREAKAGASCGQAQSGRRGEGPCLL